MAAFAPLRLAVMDDAFYTLMGKVQLLMRDLRTTVVHWCATPGDLVAWIEEERHRRRPPDAIVVDVEYLAHTPLAALIARLRAAAPGAAVVCLSQYGEPPLVEEAIAAGARGFLIKEEVRLGLATAIWRAHRAKFVTTPGVEALLSERREALWQDAYRLPRWQIHPELTARANFERVTWLKLVFGMSTPLVAEELHLAPSTVNTYVKEIYNILEDGWLDDRDLNAVPGLVKGERFRSSERAYHLLTQFRRNVC